MRWDEQAIYGMEEIALPSLEKVVAFYESAANIMHPCLVNRGGSQRAAFQRRGDCGRVRAREPAVGYAGLRCHSSRPNALGRGHSAAARGAKHVDDYRDSCAERCRRKQTQETIEGEGLTS